MEKPDLSHWDTVGTLEFGQAVRLALGVDPYADMPLDETAKSKERLLREQMSDAHLRAANWAHNFLVWKSRTPSVDLQELFDHQPPFIPIPPISPERLSHVIGEEVYFRKGPVRGLQLPTIELQRTFEMCAQSYGLAKGMTLIAEFGNLRDVDELERETLADWFRLSGWKSEYDFGVFSDIKYRESLATDCDTNTADSDETPRGERLAHPRTEKNYLALIAAMAIDGYGFEPNAKQSPLPRELAELLTRKFDYSLTDESIRRYLQMGAGHLLPTNRNHG